MGILLMYDVTSLESYNNLSYWLRNIQEVIKLLKLSHFYFIWRLLFNQVINTFILFGSNLFEWMNEYFQNASPDVVKVLAGNKCEAPATQRMVDKERGQKVNKIYTIIFAHPYPLSDQEAKTSPFVSADCRKLRNALLWSVLQIEYQHRRGILNTSQRDSRATRSQGQ